MTSRKLVSSSRPQHCRAKRKDGKPCKAQALPSDRYCWAHSPTLAEARLAARKKGGHGSSKQSRLGKLMPPRLVPIFAKLETALDEVHDGTLEPRAASAMASLAGAIVRVLTSGELEERVRKLEGERHDLG